MNKTTLSYFITVLGLSLLGSGLYLIKAIPDSQGVMQVLPYLCVGIGCGIFGHGMGNIISYKAIKRCPDAEKQLEIERKDERNIAIGNRAKAKAYDMMIYAFGSLLLIFAFMGIDLSAVLLFVSAYIFVVSCGVYYRIKYDREM